MSLTNISPHVVPPGSTACSVTIIAAAIILAKSNLKSLLFIFISPPSKLMLLCYSSPNTFFIENCFSSILKQETHLRYPFLLKKYQSHLFSNKYVMSCKWHYFFNRVKLLSHSLPSYRTYPQQSDPPFR